MEIQIISWQQTIPLRHSVLWPNKAPAYCHVEGDIDGLHFGGFINDALVCVASIYVDVNRARLRKFAIDACYQNQGLGSKMLSHIVQSLKNSEVEFLWCDARESALAFYQRFNMCKASERFYKADVAYFKMEVAL
jgi:ribosomal protein S18 acetylase RimI-like enzyme